MQSVYIETTIPSYYTGKRPRDLVLAARQQLTIEWWDQHRSKYELFSSQVVLDETRRGHPEAAAKREDFLRDILLLDISERVIGVAEDLIVSGIIPRKVSDDAYHIACAGVHRIDYLLTWNCAHIANPHNWRKIRQQLAGHGLEMPVICTPEELIGEDRYEDSN
jgi:predicted nucleic acid-binding protein